MFGHFYLQRDAALQAATGAKQQELQLAYASELLAELLNRATTLEAAGLFWYDQTPEEQESAEGRSRLESFALAALEFIWHDCDEARVRGRRARLFAETSHGRVDVEVSETVESLDEIGGRLVPGEYDVEAPHA